MSVRLAIGITVSVLVVLIAWALCTYKREWLKEIFGLKGPGKTVDVESGGAVQLGRSDSAGGKQSDAPASMIVVAADDSTRGELMEYRDLKDACNHWSDANILGKGAAATVYRGSLTRFGQVAVKRFHQTPTGGMAYNFDRELDALCQCRHPHVLEILGRATTGPEQLIVMPLMEGGCLANALRNMSWAPRAECLGQIVTAVSFLHGKKMVHRDIKSSNILLDRVRRHARLADFGLAKDQVKGSRHGTTGIVVEQQEIGKGFAASPAVNDDREVGSPGYMAPELMMRPANEKTDAFALGVVILEILTGQPAWDEGREAMALGDAAVSDGIFDASMVDAQVQVLGDCAAKLTCFDPNQRLTVHFLEESQPFREHLARARQSLT
ncbi:unnamed protein product [Durusdinium trenchii]|uniref:Protein kinase domain-containing protein n=1 Tax=Durusdinium trenchii TaxID=1381693 RepID=A0ABP0N2V6_9DINO